MLAGVTLLLQGAASEAAKGTQPWTRATPLMLDAMQNHERVMEMRQSVEVRSHVKHRARRFAATEIRAPAAFCAKHFNAVVRW